MTSVVTAVSAADLLQQLGGYRDSFRLAQALATAGGFTLNTVTGGATAVSGNLYVVLDGSTVTLPTPSSTALVIVMGGGPSAPCTVAPASTNTINGANANVTVGPNAVVFKGGSSTAWTTE